MALTHSLTSHMTPIQCLYILAGIVAVLGWLSCLAQFRAYSQFRRIESRLNWQTEQE